MKRPYRKTRWWREPEARDVALALLLFWTAIAACVGGYYWRDDAPPPPAIDLPPAIDAEELPHPPATDPLARA